MRPLKAWKMLVTGVPVVLLACGGDDTAPSGAAAAVPVGVWIVRNETVEHRREWMGRVEPLRTVSLAAPAGGQVEQVDVRDGDTVRPGQSLLRIVSPDLAARRSALRERLVQLEDDLARWERLAAGSAAAAGEVAEARLRVLQAREQFAEHEALEGALHLRAPAAGRVYGLAVGPGTLVSAGQQLLGVEDGGTWGVRLAVAAWEAPYFDDVARLSVRDARGMEFTVERTALASEVHPGFVRVDLYVRQDGSAAAGTAPSRGGGEVGYVTTEEVLLVPWTAVAGVGDEHWVAFVVPGEPATIERRTIELGRPHPGGVEVVSGLEAGDMIVRYEPRSHPAGRVVSPVERGQ
jgi:membrane fusion protein, multidrug efflux system